MIEIPKKKSKRGFASMTPEKRREIARLGGASVPKEKRNFNLNRDLATIARSKGGQQVSPKKRAFAVDLELAAAAGAKGRRSIAGRKRKED